MFPSMWAGSNSILMFCFSVQNFQSLHMNLLWRDLLESKDKKELQKGDLKKILTAVYTHQSRQGAEGVQTSRLCMPPSHPRLLFLPNLRNPLSTSSQSCTITETLLTHLSPAASLFSELVKAYEIKNWAPHEEAESQCATLGMTVPGQLQGGTTWEARWLCGHWGHTPQSHVLSLQVTSRRKLVLPPDKRVLGLW